MIIKPRYNGPQMPTTYAVTMTAAGSGINGITVADDADIDFGTGDFFLHWEGSLPDWTPPVATVSFIWKWAASTGYVLFLTSGGSLRLQINSTVYIATALPSFPDGAAEKITIVITRETALSAGSVVFYANGQQLGSSVAISSGAPSTVSNAEPLYISGSPSARTASNTISCIVGNFAPTAAEVLDLCTNGIPESWKWGSQAPFYTSDFSAGVNGWAVSGSGAIAGNIDAVSDGSVSKDNCLRFTSGASLGTKAFFKTSTLASGKKNSAVISVYVPSGQTYIDGFRIYADSNSGTLIYDGTGQNGGWLDIDVSFVPAGTAIVVYCYDGTSTSINAAASGELVYIVGVETKKIGATFAALPETIPTSGALEWPDSSGNTGGGTLPASGATKVTIRR